MKFYIALVLISQIVAIYGHGMMANPPARNCMWRLGYDTPPDYNDNSLYCGGYAVQWEQNDGKCGVCGDNYADPQPRAHEAGGYYATGTIAKHYVVDQNIDISIDLTANHAGHFEIRICPNNDVTKIVSQDCLDLYPMKIVGKDSTLYPVPVGVPGFFNYSVELPKGLTCSQCVVQWTYTAGNNWGTCDNGTQAVGCGPQETFVNCADVDIYSSVEQRDLAIKRDNILAKHHRPLGQKTPKQEKITGEGAENLVAGKRLKLIKKSN